MKIYLVDWWVPSPLAWKGGLQCVIAKDDASCARILAELDTVYGPRYIDFHKRIEDCVRDALSLELAKDHEEGLVKEFVA